MEWPAGTFSRIDAIFPYVCFAYGAVMTFVLSSDPLNRIADEKLPAALLTQWRSHRPLAFVCLVAGTVWILQNLWLT